MAYNVHAVPLPIYVSMWVKVGPQIKRNGTFSFKEKGTPLIIFKKMGKFGIDLVDSMLNKL